MFFGCVDKKAEDIRTTITVIPYHTSELTEDQIKKIDVLTIDFPLSGFCYADEPLYELSFNNKPKILANSPNDNLPKKVDSNFPLSGLYLVINQKEYIENSHLLCYKLYLANTTDKAIHLEVCHQILNIVAEAKNEKGEWIPITYVLQDTCGNSYHMVTLDKSEYWEFNVPVFKGNFKTKLRYALLLDKKKKNKLYSNEIDVEINKSQFSTEIKYGLNKRDINDLFHN